VSPDRVAAWVAGIGTSAALAGYGIADSGVAGVAPAVVTIGLAWCFAMDLEHHDDAPDPDPMTAELLREVLEEHGPMECDPDCGCSACRGWRHLMWLGAQDVPHVR
jgi:hypothetical protein